MTPSNATAAVPCEVKDLSLAGPGKRRIEWSFQLMPVLQTIRKQFIKDQPLNGLRLAACLPVTAENASLIITLRDGGADVALSGSEPAQTHDDVAASLVKDYLVPVFGSSDDDAAACRRHAASILDRRPQILLSACDELIVSLHAKRPEQAGELLGATEESSAGVSRIRALARQQPLGFPVIAARQATTTHLVDSRYGSGQSTFDALLQASGVLLAGLTVVVAGFGWTGKGLAARARGLGANVVVTEVHPLRAIEAVMEGYRVLSMNEAAAIGDVFITGTGTRTVLAREHFDRLKDGAMLANAGDCRAEIDLEMLGRMSNSRKEIREFVEEYRLRDGRRVWVLADGRPLNVAVRGGQPPSVRDVTLANHALSAEYLARQSALLEKKVHAVPETIDRQVARMKLSAMRIAIDKLTIEQEEYLAGWSEGT